jgi:hypothetical protein
MTCYQLRRRRGIGSVETEKLVLAELDLALEAEADDDLARVEAEVAADPAC